MTVKAGQKCTAIRRAMAPAQHLDAVQEALSARLAKVKVGDPRDEATHDGRAGQPRPARIGARGGADVGESVRASCMAIRTLRRWRASGAFLAPILLRSDDPWGSPAVHDVEAFGPVSTIMPYRDLDDAIALANRGMGSLALSLFTFDQRRRRGLRARRRRLSRPDGDPRPDQRRRNRPATARRSPSSSMAGRAAPAAARRWAGCAASSITCSAPRSRAGRRCCRRSSASGCPAPTRPTGDVHPFRKRISELEIGYTLKTASRTVTLDDIEHFAAFHRRHLLRPYGRGGGQGLARSSAAGSRTAI